jgi:hypothetical protein
MNWTDELYENWDKDSEITKWAVVFMRGQLAKLMNEAWEKHGRP